jgi:hypothetical protein
MKHRRNSDVAPCPKCGSDDYAVYSITIDGRDRFPFSIECADCRHLGPVASTADNARLGWNAFARLERQR